MIKIGDKVWVKEFKYEAVVIRVDEPINKIGEALYLVEAMGKKRYLYKNEITLLEG